MSKVDISKFYHLADTLVMKLNLFTKPKVVVEGQSLFDAGCDERIAQGVWLALV